MKKVEDMKVVSQRKIAYNIFELTLSGKLVNEKSEPGQFVHVKVADSSSLLLRRPLSICDVDEATPSLTIIYRIEGAGTIALSKKVAGDVVNVLGPLGQGFPLGDVESGETVLLVGGGVGIPPLYYLSKQLSKKGVTVIHSLGFQSREDVFLEAEFKSLGETYISTSDGSYGYKGFVTEMLLAKELDQKVIYSCGPEPMLKAVSELFANRKLYLSLEQRMGCGVGACFACVCPSGPLDSRSTYKKVCTDGPVFQAGEVVLG